VLAAIGAPCWVSTRQVGSCDEPVLAFRTYPTTGVPHTAVGMRLGEALRSPIIVVRFRAGLAMNVDWLSCGVRDGDGGRHQFY
jgi:hypothetical protein